MSFRAKNIEIDNVVGSELFCLTFHSFFYQGSPWSDYISLAILNFHESGVMEELETTWIDTKKCAEESNSPATLGLNHMLGMNYRLDLVPVVQKLDSAIHRINHDPADKR